MNQLYVGFTKKVERPKGWWLSIDDEVIEHPKGRVFDPMKHCFNPLKDLDYKRARELAKLFYTISPGGKHADGKKRETGAAESPDESRPSLVSPVLKRVLCSDGNEFSFAGPNAKSSARINRSEIGDFDALVLGLLLMSYFVNCA